MLVVLLFLSEEGKDVKYLIAKESLCAKWLRNTEYFESSSFRRLTCHGVNCDYCIFTTDQILPKCRYRLNWHFRYSQGDGVAQRGEHSSGYCLTAMASIWPSLRQAAPLLPWEGSGSWATCGSSIQPVNTLARALQRDASLASWDRAKCSDKPGSVWFTLKKVFERISNLQTIRKRQGLLLLLWQIRS